MDRICIRQPSECLSGAADIRMLGRRILQAAAMATAVHAHEIAGKAAVCSGDSAESGGVKSANTKSDVERKTESFGKV